MTKLYNDDCAVLMQAMADECVDLTVTSPPYDNLRSYNGAISQWNFDKFKLIAQELYRITKPGGVVVWVVADATVDGSESGTSFEQALYFKQIGFNLHDTMIYQKQNYVPLTHNRYEQEFEYMFVLSKGKPKTFNPIMIPCKYAGTETWGSVSVHKTADSGLVSVGKKTVNETKQHGNIFTYLTGKLASTDTEGHPAPFPPQLAHDHITTWSNPGDTVFDCFLGSGTTGVEAVHLDRYFIGCEIDESYFKIAKERIERAIREHSFKKEELF